MLAHVAGFWALRDLSRPQARDTAGQGEVRFELVLLSPPPPPALPPPEPEPLDEAAALPPPPRPAPRPIAAPEPPPVVPEPPGELPPPRALAERLFREDGSLAFAEGLLERVDAETGVGRVFEYRIAGLETAGELFERPPALVYEATRFDGYWQPTQDVLTDVLERAVRASTATVRIPIPGRPGWRLVCSVVVLAVSGGCGIAGPNNPVLGLDDPNTLDADEQRACETLWEQIARARSQSERLTLGRLYETGCRKPSA